MIELERATWDTRAERDICAIRDASAADVAEWHALVTAGESQLLAVIADGRRIGSVVYSVEAERTGRRGIIVQAIACDAVVGLCVTAEVLTRMRALAALGGCDMVRCITTRPGLVRRLTKAGATTRTVCEVPVG